MQVDYRPFIDRVIDRYEGGYGWNRKDPGGPTKYGITCYDLAEHRGQTMTSMAAWAPIVKAMTRAEAEDIYAVKYAARLRFNDLNPGKDTVLADYGINSGVLRPIRVTRSLLKLVPGSTMDDATVNAINAADPKWFIDAVCNERLYFMRHIRGGSAWEEFGKGWGARVEDLDHYSTSLATRAPAPTAPDLSQVATPKATHTDPTLVTKSTSTTAVITAGQTVATHAGNLPYWAIAAGAVVVIIAGVAYVVWKQRSNEKANSTVILPPSVQPVEVPHAV